MEVQLDRVIRGDALSVLKTLPTGSVHSCITSPPYWAMRDYGIKNQLGLEPAFSEYIAKVCDIFDEIRRILKTDGSCWVNIGDTYFGDSPVRKKKSEAFSNTRVLKRSAGGTRRSAKSQDGVRAKSLCQIPARFAIEMMNRGWRLRNEIIWHKATCITTSARDRLTHNHERLFFFTKTRHYYFTAQNRNSSVWTIPPSTFRSAHSATFPYQLVTTPLQISCPPGGIVIDPFLGSGTTALVAKQLGRHYIGIELNPEYVKIAENRLKEPTLFG
jgi:DNA modification methylase